MAAAVDVWDRLREHLGRADAPERAGEARVGATLALVRQLGDGPDADHELLFTRRREDLRTHPGQICFPGGRVDDGESLDDAALREAAEEVGLDSRSVTILGALPVFYVAPSRFWLQTIVARWDAPHPLTASEDEVGEIVRVRVSELADPARWRAVWLSVAGWTWAWRLDGDHVLWGATAVVTAWLLDRIAPGWNQGTAPGDLPPEQVVEPWRAPVRAALRPWLPGAPAVPAADCPAPWPERPSTARLEAAAAGVAEAVDRLGAGRLVVLAGGGGNGLAGLAAARRLADTGRDVRVVTDRPVARLPERARELLDGVRAAELDGELPRADLYVDAVVGGGLAGPLRGGARDLLLALRRRDAPVLAVDVPSGLSGRDGLVGESVAARVCLVLGGPRPGTLRAGVEPFVGDLYAIDEGGGLSRVLRGQDPEAPRPGWRE